MTFPGIVMVILSRFDSCKKDYHHKHKKYVELLEGVQFVNANKTRQECGFISTKLKEA